MRLLAGEDTCGCSSYPWALPSDSATGASETKVGAEIRALADKLVHLLSLLIGWLDSIRFQRPLMRFVLLRNCFESWMLFGISISYGWVDWQPLRTFIWWPFCDNQASAQLHQNVWTCVGLALQKDIKNRVLAGSAFCRGRYVGSGLRPQAAKADGYKAAVWIHCSCLQLGEKQVFSSSRLVSL